MGNQANHEIVHYVRNDAEKILSFVEVLLIMTYEFPHKLKGEEETSPHST
ncbi:hypothetical protein [Polycladomyces zharkentensis]